MFVAGQKAVLRALNGLECVVLSLGRVVRFIYLLQERYVPPIRRTFETMVASIIVLAY